MVCLTLYKKYPELSKIAFLFLLFVLVSLLRMLPAVQTVDQAVYHLAAKASVSLLWLKLWSQITLLGTQTPVNVVYALLALSAFLKQKNARLVAFVFCFLILMVLNHLLKDWFHVMRPVNLTPFLKQPHSFAYPSGHAENAVLLFYFMPQFYKRLFFADIQISNVFTWILSKPVVITCVIFVCLSRLFLGMHWLTDVVGGVLWGSFVSQAGLFWYDKIQSDHL